MANITFRSSKTTGLTNEEMDGNLSALNDELGTTLKNDTQFGGAVSGTYNNIAIGAGATLTDVDINSGTIDGVTIGGASAGAGTFTTLNISGDLVTACLDSSWFASASFPAAGVGVVPSILLPIPM